MSSASWLSPASLQLGDLSVGVQSPSSAQSQSRQLWENANWPQNWDPPDQIHQTRSSKPETSDQIIQTRSSKPDPSEPDPPDQILQTWSSGPDPPDLILQTRSSKPDPGDQNLQTRSSRVDPPDQTSFYPKLFWLETNPLVQVSLWVLIVLQGWTLQYSSESMQTWVQAVA